MPIVEYKGEVLIQVCAMCRAEHEIPIAELELGADRGDGTANELVIMFPACPCGASEGVFRNLDADYSKSDRGSVHGRFVIALGEELKRRKQVNHRCKKALELEAVEAGPLEPIQIPPPW